MVVNNISIFTTLFVINQTYPILHVVLVVNESIVLSILSSFWNLEQSPAIRGWKSITLLLIFALLGWNYIVYLCTQRNWFYLLSFSPPFHCVVSTVSAWRHPPMAGRWSQSQCQKKDNPPPLSDSQKNCQWIYIDNDIDQNYEFGGVHVKANVGIEKN